MSGWILALCLYAAVVTAFLILRSLVYGDHNNKP